MTSGIDRFWRAVGGRKVGVGLLATLLMTLMAFPLHATFVEYSGSILLALGLTSGSVAFEDRKGGRPFPHRRAADAPAPPAQPAG